MANIIEINVPDIGNFKDVDVIDVLVKPGERVEAEQGLITLETDKAAMDVPSPQAGVVKELKIKKGGKASQGTPILTMEVMDAVTTSKTTVVPPSLQPFPARGEGINARPVPKAVQSVPAGTVGMDLHKSPSPPSGGEGRGEGVKSISGSATEYSGKVDLECEVLVLGSGPGGYTAAFRAADLGKTVALVERYSCLGGVCLNVGCIPSKALLHASKVIEEAAEMAERGIVFGKPRLDLNKLRAWKNSVVGKLTGGLAGLAKQRKVQVVQGVGRFISPHHLAVEAQAGKKVLRFDQCIIAAGSQAAKIPGFPEDPRILDSTSALELEELPERMLVIGGGIIGLEMACVYDALGVKITVVELTDTLIPEADRDLVRVLQKRIEKRYEQILLGVKVAKLEATKQGIKATFDGKNAPASQTYGRVLVAVGRRPNGKLIDAGKAGVMVDDRGFIPVDRQQRTNVAHIFAIGDIAGNPMLAHKASHEAKVAAEAAAGLKVFNDARAIPSVAYTDPEVAWVGLTEKQAGEQDIETAKGIFPWIASGRNLSLGRDDGMTKLLFEPGTRRILGAGIVGTNAGDLIAELALAIEMGSDATDVGLTVHPHPTLSETVMFAAEAFEGTITDLYMPKKK
ncbi:MAG: dihydrolipoyl dehydrogenase [Gammaproteobacteria bacterium]|nr:dihydrolipoyl dehydrogenase [Gammaproteobacteria bacterium]